jgi:hypothetical protein
LRLDKGENGGERWASGNLLGNFEKYSEMPKEKTVRRFGLTELLDMDKDAGTRNRNMCIPDLESADDASPASTRSGIRQWPE